MTQTKSATGLNRLVNATKYTLKGLSAAWQNEEAFRQEIYLFLVSIPLAAWLAKNFIEFVFLVAVVLLVIIVELINSQ